VIAPAVSSRKPPEFPIAHEGVRVLSGRFRGRRPSTIDSFDAAVEQAAGWNGADLGNRADCTGSVAAAPPAAAVLNGG